MTPEFLAAVIDTLLPGDDVLPSGTHAGLDPTAYAAPHRVALDAIATAGGGIEPFARADEPARTTAVRSVERTAPDAFRALLMAVLADYYESEPVLAALSWRSDAPQPTGHSLSAMDETTTARLSRVSRRDPLWRT